jgi:hypothetical protein
VPEVSINRKFVEYLMSSYLYYEEGVHVLADTQFDELCKELLDNWDSITHHHKCLTTREDLEAGTGYAIKYPLIVVASARHWYREATPRRK